MRGDSNSNAAIVNVKMTGDGATFHVGTLGKFHVMKTHTVYPHILFKYFAVLLLVLTAAGCRGPEIRSGFVPRYADVAVEPRTTTEVLVTKSDLSRGYDPIGEVFASVTGYKKNPEKFLTSEITAKARDVGADAVIKIQETSGLAGVSTHTTARYRDAWGNVHGGQTYSNNINRMEWRGVAVRYK